MDDIASEWVNDVFSIQSVTTKRRKKPQTSSITTIPFTNTKSLSIPYGAYMTAPSTLCLLNNFTYSLWLNTSATNRMGVVSYRTTSQHYRELAIFQTSGLLSLGTNQPASIYQASSGKVNDGTWHHVVMTVTTTEGASLYVDSAQVATTTLNAMSGTIESLLYIGQNVNRTSPFSGVMDEISVWSTSMDSTQVGALYNDGTPGDLSTHPLHGDLQAWWRFEDETNLTFDTTTNGRSLTFNGSLTPSTNVKS